MTNLRVLLADSDNSFRMSAQRALTRQGYFVVPAANGIDALRLLADDEIDVVVADVDLPARDGLELLRAVKAKSREVPVIFLTEPSAIGSAATGVREGAFDYLIKPIDDFTRLAGMIERVAGTLAPDAAAPPTENPAAEPVPSSQPNAGLVNAAVSGQDLNHLLMLYAAELAQLAHAPQVVVLVAHTDGQLHLAAAHGFTDYAEAGRAYVRSGGEDFAWHVAKTRQVVGQAVPITPAEGGKTETQEILGLPLLFAQDALGAAIVFMDTPREALSPEVMDGMRGLSQQASLVVELARLSALADRRNPVDPITGLLNREHFFDLADREFRRSWRFGESIGAIQLDVDDFSRLHIMLGASRSDEIMRQVARAVHPHVRNIDVVGRLDADKLGILLVNISRENALDVAERLRRAVGEIEPPIEEPTQVTASLGVAMYPREQCASVHDLFGLSAQATRAAKRAGRNRYVAV